MNKNLFSIIVLLFSICLLCSGCSMNKELQGYLLGNSTPVLFGASIGIQCLVAFAMLLRSVTKRDPNSQRTPPHWSWSFFWSDTIKSIVMTFIFILMATRVLFYFKIDSGLAIVISIFLGLIADRFGALFGKASVATFDIVDEKLDEVSDKLKHTAADISQTSKQVDAIKKDVNELNAGDGQPPKQD